MSPVGLLQTAAICAAGTMAGFAIAGKPFAPPSMAAPKLDGPSEVVNARFDTVKARSMLRAAEIGLVQTVQASSSGNVDIRDTKIGGDLLVLPSPVLPSSPLLEKKNVTQEKKP